MNKTFQPYIGTEDNFQITIARLLDSYKCLWCHVGNERKTSGRSGATLKRKGIKSGVPDILIFERRHGFGGFAIELKVGKNTVTDNQTMWLYNLDKRNWKTLVSYSLDEVIHEIENYFK